VELKEIEPPADVQETMNMVIKAENDKHLFIIMGIWKDLLLRIFH